jgi:uncharacterized protein (DUF1330 family)
MSTYERLTPTDSQGMAFAQGAQDEPVVMVDLLRFRARAAYARDYTGENPEVSGEEAYRRFTEIALQRVKVFGGRLEWGGPAGMTFIGPPNEKWDMILVIFYPSRTAFQSLMADAEYEAALVHRTAALAETRLIVCKG